MIAAVVQHVIVAVAVVPVLGGVVIVVVVAVVVVFDVAGVVLVLVELAAGNRLTVAIAVANDMTPVHAYCDMIFA